jgi:hypothetical protein
VYRYLPRCSSFDVLFQADSCAFSVRNSVSPLPPKNSLDIYIVRARVYNFHGEPGARLNVEDSVYDTKRKRTLLITLLSPLLFYAPDFHLVGLQTLYTDRLIRHRGWSGFITRLNDEWQEFILLVGSEDNFFRDHSVADTCLQATVLLNANVGLLSIQSVDQGGVGLPNRTPTQISCYLSTLTSIGAIIIGLLLVKRFRNWDRDRDRQTVQDAVSPTVPYEAR